MGKITVLGLYKHENAYFCNKWNILDFVVVLAGLTSFLPNMENAGPIKALRAARVLKPLRASGQIPALKLLLSTLGESMPGLLNVCVFFVFIILIFGILGVNTFRGS